MSTSPSLITRHNMLQSGRFVYSGYVGDKINTYADARLLGPGAWDTIYPETEAAFRNRVDDSLSPNQGLWQGEFWGKHILSAIAALEYYDDDSLTGKLQAAAAGLIASQDENGYIGTYADSEYIVGNVWNIWCRKYTLWGMVELWRYLGDDALLDAAERFLDHLISELGTVQHDIIETGNFYGLPSTSILQPVIEMYRATHKASYLEFAYYIVAQWGQHPEGIPDLLKLGLENKPIHLWFDDPDAWAKGYEFISCVEGLLELYRIDGNEDYLQAVLNIHAQLVAWEQSFIGSVSFDDKLMGARFFKNTFSEICDNIYWNRLNYSLYLLTGEVKYAEYFEETFYNGLLVGMKPDGSWGLRRQRVSHEHIPASPHCHLKHHQCCTTNLPRGFFQAGELALAADGDGLRVALYAAGSGTIQLGDGREVQVEIQGDYPFQSSVSVQLIASDGEAYRLRLRKPTWCMKMSLRYDNEHIEVSESDGYLCLELRGTAASVIEIDFGDMLRTKSYEPGQDKHSEDVLQWQRELWVRRGFFAEDGVGQVSNLTAKDPRGEEPALAFFLGPLALARDIRLGEDDIFSTLASDASQGSIEWAEMLSAPLGITRSFTLRFNNGYELSLCDYPSAGNTWDESSKFSTWIDVV